MNLHRLRRPTFAALLMAVSLIANRAIVRNASAEICSGAGESLEVPGTTTIFNWNVNERELPLLTVNGQHLMPGFDQSLNFPAAQFDLLMFKALTFDEERGIYLLPAFSKEDRSHTFIEFAKGATPGLYVAANGSELLDRGNSKTVKTADGTRYLFVLYPDDEFRCATIKNASGSTLNLLYTANGLALHGVVDSTGRTITFNYGHLGIESVTQTWMAKSEGFTKTWAVGEQPVIEGSTKYAHALSLPGKLLPGNALIRAYTHEMAASDELLAQIFGGPNAVVGGNGFEPAGLAASYPFYRGDIVGDDGKIRAGHLSHALHIYGSPDGTGDSALYVPAGFTSHSSGPSPTDAAMLFYYPRLGNLTDVTLAVFHVTNFQMTEEGNRVRIGNLGGPGGSSPLYRHSHIEFYRGNVSSLPSASARAALRIDPITVFGSH